jgi:hypothetical protein
MEELGTRKFSQEELDNFQNMASRWVLPVIDFNKKSEKNLYSIYIIRTFMEINRIRAECDYSIESNVPSKERTLGKTNPNYTYLLKLLTDLLKKGDKDDQDERSAIEIYNEIIKRLKQMGISTDVPISYWEPLIDVRHCQDLSDILCYLVTLPRPK